MSSSAGGTGYPAASATAAASATTASANSLPPATATTSRISARSRLFTAPIDAMNTHFDHMASTTLPDNPASNPAPLSTRSASASAGGAGSVRAP